MAAPALRILLTAHLINLIYPHNHIPMYLYLTRVGPCHNVEATDVSVNEMSITRTGNHFSVSGQLNVSRDIPDGWMVRAIMKKCQDIRNMDTCDHFKSFMALENACTEDEVSDDTYLYHSVFNVSDPRLSCPLRAGAFRISNYSYVTRDNHRMVSESKISTSMFGYTFRLEGYSDAEMIMCIEAYLQLIYSRNLLGSDNVRKESESEDSSEDSVTEADKSDDTGDTDGDGEKE